MLRIAPQFVKTEFPLNGRCDTDMAFRKSHGSYRKLRHIQRHNKTEIGIWVGWGRK